MNNCQCNKKANYRGIPCKYCGKWINHANPREVSEHSNKCEKRKVAISQKMKEFWESEEGKKFLEEFKKNQGV